MKDYKVVIDAGHGGDDPGSSGNGIIEKELTLKISQYMYDRLKELGIPVTMTRTTDETLNPTDRVNRILDAYGNNSNVIVVSNHINAGGGDGAEVIYALRNSSTLANDILKNIEATGQNVRKAYQRRLPSDTSKDYYFIHRNTGKTQPIIVEYGFLDSTGDDVDLLKNHYEELTEAVVKGIAEYVGAKYVPISGNYYTVQRGDSLWSIAKKFGVTVNELKDANNLSSNILSIGQLLKIPTQEQETTTSDTYIVKSGDSLYSIAQKYNTTVDELKKLNNLTSNLLSIGQSLKIPTKSENNYIEYTVKKGDNLYSISRNYGLTQSELMDYNNLTSNLLSIGQILKIPVSKDSTSQQTTYIVQKGDSLYSIAQKYNTTVDSIRRKNNLTSNLLSIGQKLII